MLKSSNEKKSKKPLGKGLSELLGGNDSKDISEDKSQVQMIPIEILHPGPYQPRDFFDPEKLTSLAASIKENGILQPILVRHGEDGIEIIAGERRWRAAQLAGMKEIPSIFTEFSDQKALEAGLIENIQRADLTSIEEASGYKKLMETFNYTQEDLSQKIGKSRSHIANTVRLLTLPNPVQKFICEGKLSAGHARILVGHENSEAIAEQAIKKGMNVRQLELYMKRYGNTLEPANMNTQDPDKLHIERQLSQLLGFKTSLRVDRKGGGKIEINFKDMADIDSLMQILMKMKGYAA